MEFLNKTIQVNLMDYIQNIPNASFAISLFTIFAIILGYYIILNKDLPRGPTGLPILGFWPFLKDETCHLQLMAFKKKYGDIFSFRITGRLYINLASLKVLREAHVTKSDCFQERTESFTLLGTIFQGGVVFSNGEKWTTIRKFFLQQFRERGMTSFNENTAGPMYEIIAKTIEELRKNVGKLVDINGILTRHSNRIVRQTLFGSATPITEEDIQAIQTDYRIVSSIIKSSTMVLIGRIAKYFIMPFLPNYRKGMKTLNHVKGIFQRIVEDHEKTFDGDNVRDIIDSYIQERNKRRSKNDPTAHYFTDEALVASLVQFVGDGVLNVATLISTFLAKILEHPEEQERLYKELIEVVGVNRNPGLEDKNKLPYTNAFFLEAHRCINFVVIFPNLECIKETTLCGYRIPKGAITLTNIYSIHNDPELYEDPEKFNPSRFLPKDGRPKAESPITFGVGKRVCLGESFVKNQVFLFCTAIVKNFQIKHAAHGNSYEIMRKRKLEICVFPRN